MPRTAQAQARIDPSRDCAGWPRHVCEDCKLGRQGIRCAYLTLHFEHPQRKSLFLHRFHCFLALLPLRRPCTPHCLLGRDLPCSGLCAAHLPSPVYPCPSPHPALCPRITCCSLLLSRGGALAAQSSLQPVPLPRGTGMGHTAHAPCALPPAAAGLGSLVHSVATLLMQSLRHKNMFLHGVLRYQQ